MRPISQDALTLSALVAALLVLGAQASTLSSAWRALLLQSIAATSASQLHLAPLLSTLRSAIAPLLHVAVASCIAVLLALCAQGALSLRARQPLKIPVQPQRLLSCAWLCTKLVVLGLGLASITNAAVRALVSLPTADLGYALRVLDQLAQLARSRLGVLLALLVVADLIVTRVLWRRSLRMTHDELKRELREIHGDPGMRGEQRRRHHDQHAVG